MDALKATHEGYRRTLEEALLGSDAHIARREGGLFRYKKAFALRAKGYIHQNARLLVFLVF
jgi:hypothetical protein